nr:MAG TPA: hypothetical protein [Caudoviricetes sp.]
MLTLVKDFSGIELIRYVAVLKPNFVMQERDAPQIKVEA